MIEHKRVFSAVLGGLLLLVCRIALEVDLVFAEDGGETGSVTKPARKALDIRQIRSVSVLTPALAVKASRMRIRYALHEAGCITKKNDPVPSVDSGFFPRLPYKRHRIYTGTGKTGHLRHNGLWAKNTNFEAAVRVPLIVSSPNARAKGASSDALVELVDLYPTLADLCLLPIPTDVHGTSFAPLLDQPKRPWKKAAFSQTPRPFTRPKEAMGRSLRTDRYRFVEWTGTTISEPLYELYDYTDSEPEKMNLAGQPKYQSVVEELTKMLHAGRATWLPPHDTQGLSRP